MTEEVTAPTLAKADEWLAALESGKYAQGTGHLCTPNGYCCLGVYADVTDKLVPYGDSGVYGVTRDGCGGSHVDAGMLADYDQEAIKTTFNVYVSDLVRINDDCDHATFPRIAEFLRAKRNGFEGNYFEYYPEACEE